MQASAGASLAASLETYWRVERATLSRLQARRIEIPRACAKFTCWRRAHALTIFFD